MTMADDYKEYWELGETDDNGDCIYWSKDDTTAEDHMPPKTVRGSGSLCIMNSKVFRWQANKETWIEM